MARLLGLDLGSKTIGVALSDGLGLTAQGYTLIHRTSLERDIAALHTIISEHEVTTIVLGLPKMMNNTLGPQAIASQEFSELLREQFGVHVVLWDERLTSVAANRMLKGRQPAKRKQLVDVIAATLILDSYLSSSEFQRQNSSRSENSAQQESNDIARP